MQKFTEKEKVGFDKKRVAAEEETQAKFEDEIEKETARVEAEIESAKAARDAGRQRNSSELRGFKREMEDRIRIGAGALLKERFPYAVFLYDAEKVGITSTGEADQNELYPNPKQH